MTSLPNVWICNMLRHLGLIAVCACIVASVGCDGRTLTAPDPPPTSPSPSPPPPVAMVTVEFGGRVVNADAGGPVGNVRVALGVMSHPGRTDGWVFPKDTATSGGDGTFTLPLDLPMGWRSVSLELTAPPGYDDTSQSYERIGPGDPFRPTAADRPAIRMYPTLVIRPGESIEVRVESSINVWCGFDGYACRRVLVAGSSGDPVELEVVSHDSSKRMALGLAIAIPNIWFPVGPDPDMSVRRLTVPPGGVPYVISDFSTGTATLTARR